MNINTQSLFDCMFKNSCNLKALYPQVILGLVLKNFSFTLLFLYFRVMRCPVDPYKSFRIYSFNVWLVSLLLDAIQRGFKADLIELRHLPNAVPSVTFNVEGMNHAN